MLTEEHDNPAVGSRDRVICQPSLKRDTVLKIHRAEEMKIDRSFDRAAVRRWLKQSYCHPRIAGGEWIEVGEGRGM